MSTILQPYAIKIDKLKSIFDSKNQKLFDELIETDDFEYLSEEEEEWMEKFDVTTEVALKSIIFGGKKKGRGFTYGYALKLIVSHLGESMAIEGDVFYFGDVFEEVNLFLANNNVPINLNNMLDEIYKFDIPKIDDYPYIGGISKELILSSKKALEKIDITEDEINYENEKYDEIKEKVHILRRCINFCIENDMDWITFAH